MPTKKQIKALDAQIETLYKTACPGAVLDIFDIVKVFEVGRKANDEGRDLKEAIVEFINKVRKDKPIAI